MGMHELDALLAASRTLFANDGSDEALDIVWNLESLADRLELDAGLPPSGTEPRALQHVFELGLAIMRRAAATHPHLVYDWTAFLLNFWSHMPDQEDYSAESIRQRFLGPMMALYAQHDFSRYEPSHATLTLYPDGASWFEDEHANLIKSFFAPEKQPN